MLHSNMKMNIVKVTNYNNNIVISQPGFSLGFNKNLNTYVEHKNDEKHQPHTEFVSHELEKSALFWSLTAGFILFYYLS